LKIAILLFLVIAVTIAISLEGEELAKTIKHHNHRTTHEPTTKHLHHKIAEGPTLRHHHHKTTEGL
jgi:hypothetical protein